MQRETFLGFKSNRYLKVTTLVVLIAAVSYIWHRRTHFNSPGDLGYGGSWMGYALGTLTTLLIIWLMWLGARKRSYRSSHTTLQGWLSAHVYLGLSTVVLATLHCGFEFGPNVHTLAFGLLLLVVGSGVYGAAMLLKIPREMTAAMGQDSLQSLVLAIQEIDNEAQRLAMQLPDEVNLLVLRAAERTRMRGTVFDHITKATSLRCPTRRAIKRLQAIIGQLGESDSRQARQLLTLLVRRQTAVSRIRQEYRSMARLRLWLLLHVPLSFLLMVALAAHITSVFIYT